ncbi:GSCOCG00009208001-RA-CDS [Cotesia congregata]|nr:GSCOCG00009208001-RA-CDS [Cotesia congregata]
MQVLEVLREIPQQSHLQTAEFQSCDSRASGPEHRESQTHRRFPAAPGRFHRKFPSYHESRRLKST